MVIDGSCLLLVHRDSREHAAKVEEIKKFQSDVREIDKLAREKVKGYSKLSDASKGMIRKLIREGRANGVPEADILMYASVSARSGIDVQFDKEECYRGVKEDGSLDYADGFYEASKNRIVVNPDGKRSAERLVIHELDHAIRKFFDKKGNKATRIYFEAIQGVSPEVREKIAKEYKKMAKPGEAAALVMDETNAYYAEQVLGNKYTLEKLLEEEPTLKDKILSFFKGAGKDYANVPKLSGAAKKYYRTYKKLFDDFSARNAENNAIEKPLTSMKTENMQDSGRRYAIKFLTDDDVDKYLKAGGRSNKYKQEAIDSGKKIILTTSQETRNYIEKSIAGEKGLPTVAYGIVDKKLSKDASDYSDDKIKINDYYLELVSNDIQHAYKEHSKAKEKGDIDLSIEDFSNIPLYVATYDDFVYAIKYKSGNTKICLSKKTSDGRVLIIETVSKSHGSIEFKNLICVSEDKYINEYENKYKKRNSTNTGGNVSSNNSPRDATVSMNSIPQTEGKSNSFDKKYSDRQDALDLGDSHKQAQFDVIQKTNPMWDEYHVGIRSADDIRTWEEVLKLDDESEGQFVWGDFSRADAEQALKNGKVTVYSSYPIKNGVFVSTSYIQAEQYSGGRGGKVYSKTVPLDKIAWINGDEGQYADATTASGKQYALDIDSEGENISGAEAKKPKASGKTKAQIRAEQVVENQKVRTKAEYTTDKVFSQASVKRGFESIEAVKKLPGDVREKIARDLWLELEASDSEDVRDTFSLKYSVKLYQAIRDSDYENFENMSPQQKDVLQAQLRDTVRQITKSGKESKLSRMKKDVRGTVKLEERVRSEYLSGIYQTLKKIDDKKKHRFASASAYKGDLFKSTIDRLTRITSCSSSRSILSYSVLTMVAPIAVSSTSAKPSF